ncbi:MAG: serine/threonine protein kinase [Planctomycetaceae bacterium]|nr:serine/threonine protein kinase [Planctomycetaceae bacterium]
MIVNLTDRFVGQQIADGRYEVVDVLGEGAMGMIFLAEDSRLGSDVVIKVPSQRVLAEPEFIERFKREIRSLVQLSHPHVVKIIDVGEHDDAPFVVMQYLSGGSLSDHRQEAGGQLPPSSLKNWLKPIADAVDFVHKQDVIHRDVKPANILFDAFENAFLADFGLSKVLGREDLDERANSLTATGFVVGTPQYVAPEIVMGHDYDGRADQYSLAMTVYEVLAGECPVAGSTPSATMVNQINVVPPLLCEKVPGIPPALAKAVAKGLEKSPKKRFESCVAFADAVLASFDQPTVRKKPRSSAAVPTQSSGKTNRPKSGEVRTRKPLKSKGEPGRVPCPQCKKVLPLKDAHRGKKGKCVQCKTKLLVGTDLATLTIVEDRPEYTGDRLEATAMAGNLPPRVLKQKSKTGKSGGGQKERDDDETLLGEEVFGWRISPAVASLLAVVLVLVLIAASVFIGRKTNEDDKEVIPKDKRTEIKKDVQGD